MSDEQPITIDTATQGETLVLAPRGDVDMNVSPVLRQALRQALQTKPPCLVVDMSGVSYMDSSGVATLVEAMKLARAAGTRLVLCAMNDRVRGIFEIARLDQYFTIVPSLDDAAGA